MAMRPNPKDQLEECLVGVGIKQKAVLESDLGCFGEAVGHAQGQFLLNFLFTFSHLLFLVFTRTFNPPQPQ